MTCSSTGSFLVVGREKDCSTMGLYEGLNPVTQCHQEESHY